MQSLQNADLVSYLDKELHDLAQPISSLQCRLEIAKILDTDVASREAVEGGLEDLQRVMQSFKRMRTAIADAVQRGA